jgi:hypothetical protein
MSFSRYDLDGESDEEDEDVFLTPSEGLSEIGEDEEEAVVATAVPITSASPQKVQKGLASRTEVNDPITVPTDDKPLDPNNVVKGKLSNMADVLGTGPSTLRRSQAQVTDMKVKARAISKADALSIDQSALLGADVDTTRELLALFLRSKMREAEEVCIEKDPEGNHLYLQVAYCIFQALKVS